MGNISLAVSWWFVAICILVAAVYATLLYLFPKPKEDSGNTWLKWLLSALRFVVVFFLCFFLLRPFIDTLSFNKEKPIALIAVDNSLSVAQSVKPEDLRAKLKELEQRLSERYQVDILSFGDEIRPNTSDSVNFTAGTSNYSALLSYVNNNYEDNNLSLICMLGDGIYNKGSEPVLKSTAFAYPVFAIGLGDTSAKLDGAIDQVLYNSVAYLGNEFPVQIDIQSFKLQGKQSKVSLYNNGIKVAEQSLTIRSSSDFQELSFKTKATKLGANKLDVVLSVHPAEENEMNNKFSFVVDVVESRKKIELWTESLHPDLGAFRFLIEQNDNYSFSSIKNKADFKSDKQDLVILYNWFASPEQRNLFERLKANGIATLCVFGPAFNAQQYNSASMDVKFKSFGSGQTQALPAINPVFEYFELDDAQITSVNSWPPLNVPFGRFSGFKDGDVLCTQRIGNVSTDEPLILLRNEKNYRYGIISGDGLWQWRLNNFERNGEHQTSTALIQNMLQYLTVKDNKKLLRVYPSKKVSGAGEAVVLIGELYNQSLEVVKNAEIQLSIKSDQGNSMERVMGQSASNYKLSLNNLRAGSYTYSAKVSIGGQLLQDQGYFSVMDNQLELLDTKADFKRLEQISTQTGGVFNTLEDMGQLADNLIDNDEFVSVIKEERTLTSLIDIRALFWFLLALLSIEWFIRKFIGGY